MHKLRGITWNSEGFKDPGKHLFVKESIREYDLDFIALLEIGRSSFSNTFYSRIYIFSEIVSSTYKEERVNNTKAFRLTMEIRILT
jgi:hypothetical protein